MCPSINKRVKNLLQPKNYSFLKCPFYKFTKLVPLINLYNNKFIKRLTVII